MKLLFKTIVSILLFVFFCLSGTAMTPFGVGALFGLVGFFLLL